MTPVKIRLSKSSLDDREIEAVTRVLRLEYLGMGKEVQAFEQELATFLQVDPKQVTVVNSGTSALVLALAALDIGPGDEVLVPSLTFVASFQAIAATGATPVACEVNPDTLFIDPEDMERRVTERTKAVMPVCYASNAVGIDGVYEVAGRHSLRVVEDAAHAFGGTWNNAMIGQTGDLVCFSFDGIKNITSGEVGAIICHDDGLSARIRDGRLLGVEKDTEKRFAGERSWDFDVHHTGYRFHMSDILAAIGRVQLGKVAERIAHRRALVRAYVGALAGQKGIALLPFDYAAIAPHIFVVRIKGGKRNAVFNGLKEMGIESGIHYKPNHLLSRFRANYDLPNTMNAYHEVLTLPLHNDLSLDDVHTVVDAVISLIRK